jgi:hypothetical protein
MKGYWSRIVLGALVVFGAGMGVWYAVARAKQKVQVVVESAMPITIPIPFSIVPFKVEGEKYGSVHHVTFHRDAPKSVDHLVVQVKLAEGVDAEKFEDCLLALEDVDDLDEHTTFQCISTDIDDAKRLGLVPFGKVRLDPSGLMVPLLLPEDDVAELRHTDEYVLEEEQARMEAAEERWAADSARMAVEGLADSISAQVEQLVDSLVHLKRVIRKDARAPRPPRAPKPEVKVQVECEDC